MPSTNMARIQDLVRMDCPGAMDGIIRLSIFNMMKEFFQRSDAWLLEIPVFIVPETNDYQLTTGQNVVINRLMMLERPRSPPPPEGQWPPAYLPTCPPQFLPVAAGAGGSTPDVEAQNPLFRVARAGALLNAGSKCPILRIVENPNAQEVWIATVALTPCDPTDGEGFVEPPDYLMEKYLAYIACGAVAKLMTQPAKPYSSVPGSQYNGRKFNEGVGLARKEVRHMFNYSGQRWQFPQGWNARSRSFGSYTGSA
jgi:hypothetical protein